MTRCRAVRPPLKGTDLLLAGSGSLLEGRGSSLEQRVIELEAKVRGLENRLGVDSGRLIPRSKVVTPQAGAYLPAEEPSDLDRIDPLPKSRIVPNQR